MSHQPKFYHRQIGDMDPDHQDVLLGLRGYLLRKSGDSNELGALFLLGHRALVYLDLHLELRGFQKWK